MVMITLIIKTAKYKVVDVVTDPSLGHDQHTRDPKVWLGKNGHVYMILGSKIPHGDDFDGEVLFYESEDGMTFTYKNRFTILQLGICGNVQIYLNVMDSTSWSSHLKT